MRASTGMDAPFHRFGASRPSRLGRERFLEVFGGVYERSPWIAEAACDRGLGDPHDSAEGLAAELRDVVELAGPGPQLALLRAHPDLAGKLALAGGLTRESGAEQAGAGLDRCTAEEFERFQSLNESYKSRFGFPFILAVGGRGRAEILAAFERRVENGDEEEFAEALEQVHRIALLRLKQID